MINNFKINFFIYIILQIYLYQYKLFIIFDKKLHITLKVKNCL